MRTGVPAIIMILTVTFLAAGCIQLPGMHILRDSPDPAIGQWIGGEPPASDLHVIFYENQSYISRSFYLNQGEKTENGTWSRGNENLLILQSASGNITNWVYDPTEDSIYRTDLPLKKYYRYTG